MGLQPKAESASVSAPDPQHSTPDFQRLIEIKKMYQNWQKHMKSGDKDPKGKSSLPLKGGLLPSTKFVAGQDFFTEKDMLFLKSRLDEIVSKGFRPKSKELNQILEGCLVNGMQESQGFDPYGMKDEEGLNDENCQLCDEGDIQDDFDIEEVQDDDQCFGCPAATHHIEVELNDGSPLIGSPDPNKPSCEFTFEYDGNGKLIPTSNNVEEQLCQISLSTQLDIDMASSKSSKKKKKKKKSSTCQQRNTGPVSAIDESLCLFCQFKALYGHEPIHTMRWLEDKLLQEGNRRKKLKEKLESVKQAASMSQHPEQHHDSAYEEEYEHVHGHVHGNNHNHGEDLDCSLNTVVDIQLGY
ncbi:hypothetical protein METBISCDRAFT_26103 [Metschnikowia bicuspidata]|uniref:Uncharacterized protein n=1 Tax=Metschnikowia bicuspidata TaxID=27322 RepID=A0A4P9ZGD9_9ASCO|nr:hypothetical protein METBISCDRAFT_26103 [Metschnikowia bicuspidata]